MEEQERIVARVNELMELCDRLEEEQQATKAFSDELRVSTFHHMVQSEKPEDAHDALQILIEESGLLLKKPEDVGIIRNSIRALAVSGRLRTSSESDEPAALILDECIQLRKRHLENGELFQKEIFNPVDKVDEIIDLPKKWVWSRLGNILSKMGAGSTPKGGRKVYVEEGIIFLRSQNIYNDGLKLDDVAKIPIEIHQKMKGTHVRPGDVVLNITGASIARCALVPENFDTANVNQHVAICRPLKPDLNNWIHLFLTSPIGYNLIMERQVGMSREGLSMGRLGIFPIPLPPLEEQKRIVARVDELMELCDQLETKLFSQMELADEYVTASTHALVS